MSDEVTPRPESNEDWYWKRQADKLAEKAAAAEARIKELEGITSQDNSLSKENARLQAIIETGLDSELAKLVPVDAEDHKTWIEQNIQPLRERLAVNQNGFGHPTQPYRGPESSREDMILARYEQLRAVSPQEAQRFYNRHHAVLKTKIGRA